MMHTRALHRRHTDNDVAVIGAWRIRLHLRGAHETYTGDVVFQTCILQIIIVPCATISDGLYPVQRHMKYQINTIYLAHCMPTTTKTAMSENLSLFLLVFFLLLHYFACVRRCINVVFACRIRLHNIIQVYESKRQFFVCHACTVTNVCVCSSTAAEADWVAINFTTNTHH